MKFDDDANNPTSDFQLPTSNFNEKALIFLIDVTLPLYEQETGSTT